MKRTDQNNIIFAIREIRRIMEKGEATAQESREMRAILNNDNDHTAAWKQPRYALIAENENGQYRQMGERVRTLFQSITDTMNRAENEFDFMDPALQTAMATIERMGKSLPITARLKIPESFRGNPTALEMLQSLYEKYEFDTKPITEMKSPFSSLNLLDQETVTRFVAGATSEMVANNVWETSGIKRLLSKYEKGLGLDTSINPLTVEIDEVFNSTKSREQRSVITRYRKKYGAQLEKDDPDAMEEAQRLIDNDFKGPVI